MASFNDDWIWHSMLYRISKELNYNPDQIYELNITACLDWLSFFKEKDDYEAKLRDAQNGITRY